jgi:hypothetical protein
VHCIVTYLGLDCWSDNCLIMIAVEIVVLQVLNDKFSGDIEKQIPNMFPDQYFTCRVQCLSCG